jgi:beta-lactam-binding protein with PASTA domain
LTDIRPEPEGWPVQDSDTVVVHRSADTAVGGAPPAPPPPVAPGPPPPDRRIGAGMLLALATLVLVAAGVAIAYLLIHRDSNSTVTTVVLNTGTSTPATATAPAVVAKVGVPDLTGKSFADAQAALDRLGVASKAVQVASGKPAGTVLDQRPKPGARVKKGSTVTLSVARSTSTQATTTASTSTTSTTSTSTTTTTAAAPPTPQNATMPDVSSQAEAAAVQSLNSAGIRASLFFVPGQDPLGTVEQQAKPSGTTVPYGSHVQINVSSGPGDKPKVTVPSVVGKSLQDALASLNAAHLRLIFVKVPVTSRAQAGKVVQQSPLGGGQAPQNAQVAVFLGAYRS